MQICEKPSGKRAGRQADLNAALPCHKTTGDLIFIQDKNSKRRWLVDGGALVSVIPPTKEDLSRGPDGTFLRAANGSDIKCYGNKRINVHIDGRDFDHSFVIASVSHSILGSDFLAANALAPNHRDGNLLDLLTFQILNCDAPAGNGKAGVNFVGAQTNNYEWLYEKYPSVVNPDPFRNDAPKHGVRHYIPTSGHPVQSKARPLSPDKLAIAKAEIEKYVELGICHRAKSEWASPLMVAPKPDGGWRVCGDYRRLNAQTTDDKYPVKSLTDFNSNLKGKTVFSKIDMIKGYHQIPVADHDVKKTGVITPFGLFVFPKTPFGLKNAGQDFQRLMDEIFGDLPYAFVYIDDILVASNSHEEHTQHLENIFQILDENDLVINRKKCVLGASSLDFLGYHVDKDGIAPLPQKVAAIREVEPPTTVKELQRFLGMLNYYRRFIPHAAQHLFHLTESLKGRPKRLVWTKDCQKSFEAIKEALATATMLRHPDSNAALAITADASDDAIGAVLEQRGPSGWEPLAFYSAKLQPSERKWPPFDRELHAAHKAIRHFRHMVEGRPFTLFTDHKSLVPALSKKSEAHTARQTYQLSGIAEYTTDIRHVEGKANVVADFLSRPNPSSTPASKKDVEDYYISSVESRHSDPGAVQPPSSRADSADPGAVQPPSCGDFPSDPGAAQPPSSGDYSSDPGAAQPPSSGDYSFNPGAAQPPASGVERPSSSKGALPNHKLEDLVAVISAVDSYGIDLEQLAREQTLDPEYQRLSNEARTGLTFRQVDIGDQVLMVDVSNGPARPFVPYSWRRRIFDTIHGLGHPGVERTRQAVAAKFVWPSMRADVSKWARECVDCQRAKVGRHVTPPIGNFQVPEKRFAHIHIDIVNMPTSNGFSYLLTIIDRFSRWPMAVPIRDISAETVIDSLTHHWIAAHGIPQAITSDRGSQFTSAIWEQLLQTWGIKSLHTTAYHPEANGLVERFHRRLKESLIALGNSEREKWFWQLPMAMLAIRTTYKPDVGASPAQLVYGEGISLPGDLLGGQSQNSEETRRLQRQLMSNLRMEVERLQPQPTSAHRQPRVYMPGTLETASHVFVRRGGVNPPLTAPYEGPFRVADRNDQNFKVHIPGKGIEVIAINRIKPAHVSVDDDANEEPQDLDEDRPPSPRPPGRPPGVRTRIPAPTDRQTRQSSGAAQRDTANSGVPRPSSDGEGRNSSRPVSESTMESLRRQGMERRTNDPSNIPSTSRQAPHQREDQQQPNSGASQPLVVDNSETEAEEPPAPVQRPRRYFSSGGRFSKRPKVDISALTRSLIETLPEDSAAQPLLSRQLEIHDSSSGGRVASPRNQGLYRHPNSSNRRVSFNPLISKR